MIEGSGISTIEKIVFLKSIDLFSRIPGEELSEVARITEEVHVEGSEEIFREGEAGDALFLIVSGSVRIHSAARDIATLGEGQVFGEMALLDSEPRSASATANDDLVLLKIDRDDFLEILGEKPEIARGVLHVLSRRLRTSNARANAAVQGPVPAAPVASSPGRLA